MKKKNDSQEKEKRNLLILILSVVVGIAAFIGLVLVSNALVDKPQYEKAVRLKGEVTGGLPENTYLSESNIMTYFEEADYLMGTAPQRAIKSMDELKQYAPGYLNDILCAGQAVTTDTIRKVSATASKYKDKVETGFKVADFAAATCGTVRSGNYIRVDGYDKDGVLRYTLPRAYVSHAFSGDGIELIPGDANETDNTAVAFNVWLESSELENFNEAANNFVIRVTLLDE